MHRIARRDLHALIAVAMVTAPKMIRVRLKSREPLEREAAERELIDHVCNQIDNGSRMVIQAESIGDAVHRRLGEWGVDEPIPAIVPDFSRREIAGE